MASLLFSQDTALHLGGCLPPPQRADSWADCAVYGMRSSRTVTLWTLIDSCQGEQVPKPESSQSESTCGKDRCPPTPRLLLKCPFVYLGASLEILTLNKYLDECIRIQEGSIFQELTVPLWELHALSSSGHRLRERSVLAFRWGRWDVESMPHPTGRMAVPLSQGG